jgi:branched-subunit amino acid aminotransferase/4-amino-4-deoxychorismate lyase
MTFHPEVLLHTSTHLLETATSNIAIQTSDGWITPRLNRETSPFLNGVMRRYLLDQGVISDGDLTVEDLEQAKKDGRRVIGFNGLRFVLPRSKVGGR